MSEAFVKKTGTEKFRGWEEAGGEFYQESYYSDWDGFPNDTFTIRTLLPSKQTRLVNCRGTPTADKELRNTKCWKSFSSTTYKLSKRNEVQLSTLPDLSQVHTDEERIWEEMLQIKLFPVSMQQKKFLKSNLQSATKLRLQGFNELKWKHRKALQKIRVKWYEVITKLKLWQSSLKQIEGHFGTGVVAYFLFLRWLFFLNCFTFFIILIFTVLPNLIVHDRIENSCNQNVTSNSSQCYQEHTSEQMPHKFLKMLEVVQGGGAMQSSFMFYGAYSDEVIGEHHKLTIGNASKSTFYYDLALAYVFVIIACFLISLLAIVRASAREFKHRLIEGNWQSYQYCNLIFGGWDYCIHNGKSGNIKHNALYTEMKCLLLLKRIMLERNSRSRNRTYKLFLTRFAVNVAVVIMLLLSAHFIYFLFNISLNVFDIGFPATFLVQRQNLSTSDNGTYLEIDEVDTDDIRQAVFKFFVEFMPYIAIVCLNLFLPTTFNYLCKFEKYSPIFEIKISLLRTVFLRLASLIILLSRFHCIVIPQSLKLRTCWETFVGQQFYKLVITDFVIHMLITFCINLPRAICARKVNNNFVKFVGEQEFELPKHVLDIVYIQTICWLGSFYTPFLPAIVAIIIFFMFYIKKFQCLFNSTPSKILYGASRSKSMFMLILLVSYFVALVPITYAIAEVTPSRNCGPFKQFRSVWEAPRTAFANMPLFIQNIIFFFGTAGFAIPCFIILLILLYYFYAISDANKNMVGVLKNQLVLEGHDKQFLLNRLSVFLKQHQDVQGKSTHIK